MEIKQLDFNPGEGTMYSTVDETEAPPDLCQANIGTALRPFTCGEKMKRRKSGVTVCPVHGEMH